jgi:K+-sensing histidine kinase KdpD
MAYGAEAKPMVAPTRVHQVLESVLEVSASSLGRGVTISIDCKADLMARFDPALVERVLHRLVGNAARYYNRGGTIVVSARRWNDDDSVEISMTNSGPPIGPASPCGCPAARDAFSGRPRSGGLG